MKQSCAYHHSGPFAVLSPICCLLVLILVMLLAGCARFPALETNEELAQKEVAKLAEQAKRDARPASQCATKPGTPFALRKKILLLTFPIERPIEAADLPDLSRTWSRELQERLRASDLFNVADGSGYNLDSAGNIRQQIIDLAQQHGVQFVLTLKIMAAEFLPSQIRFDSPRSFMQSLSDQRSFMTEIQIFDGQNGALLKMLTHNKQMQGNVVNKTRQSLRGSFFETPLGKHIVDLITQQSEDIEDELACLPMQARVVRIDWRDIHIDVGFTSKLSAGDQLRLYRRHSWSVSPKGYNQWQEDPHGEIVIRRVFPESAIGQWKSDEEGKTELPSDQPPDSNFEGIVRSW